MLSNRWFERGAYFVGTFITGAVAMVLVEALWFWPPMEEELVAARLNRTYKSVTYPVLIAEKEPDGSRPFDFSPAWALTHLYLGDQKPEMVEYQLAGPYEDAIEVPHAFHLEVLVPAYCDGEAGPKLIFPQVVTAEDRERWNAWKQLKVKETLRTRLLRTWREGL